MRIASLADVSKILISRSSIQNAFHLIQQKHTMERSAKTVDVIYIHLSKTIRNDFVTLKMGNRINKLYKEH